MDTAPRRVVSADITDLEQFSRAQRDGSAEHLQLGTGRLRLRMLYADFGPVRMQVNTVDNDYLARALFHPGRWAMFMDIGEQPGASRINGGVMGRDGAVLFGPGAELHARVVRGQAWCMFTFATQPLAWTLDGATGPAPGEFRFLPHVLRKAADLARLSRELSGVMASDPRRFEAGAVGAAVADSIVARLGAALQGEETRPACRAQRRQVRLVAGAVDLLDAALDRAVYTAAIAGTLGASARTLNEAFRAVYGTSLHHWLRLRRLDLARRWLSDEGGPTLIKQIALDAGFWHFGRFAQAYRRMYGETPSETLAGRVARSSFVPVVCATSQAVVRAGAFGSCGARMTP